MYVQILLIFQHFQNFASICAQISVKILANPYTWRLCKGSTGVTMATLLNSRCGVLASIYNMQLWYLCLYVHTHESVQCTKLSTIVHTNIYTIYNSSTQKCTKILGNPIRHYLKRQVGGEESRKEGWREGGNEIKRIRSKNLI